MLLKSNKPSWAVILLKSDPFDIKVSTTHDGVVYTSRIAACYPTINIPIQTAAEMIHSLIMTTNENSTDFLD